MSTEHVSVGNILKFKEIVVSKFAEMESFLLQKKMFVMMEIYAIWMAVLPTVPLSNSTAVLLIMCRLLLSALTWVYPSTFL